MTPEALRLKFDWRIRFPVNLQPNGAFGYLTEVHCGPSGMQARFEYDSTKACCWVWEHSLAIQVAMLPKPEDWRSLRVGQLVRTTQDARSNGWSSPRYPRWGVLGTTMKRSDAHGLCWLVRHTDGFEEWYDDEELEVAS